MDVGKLAASASTQGASGPGLVKEVGFLSSVQPDASTARDEAADRPVDVGEAVERFRTQMQHLQRDLSFSIDDSTGDVVVQVVDGESGKVVRQIPSEEILRLSERLDEMRSLLFEAKA